LPTFLLGRTTFSSEQAGRVFICASRSKSLKTDKEIDGLPIETPGKIQIWQQFFAYLIKRVM
jgi:hypothetical protein